jgi:hypothetical protein
MASRFPFLAQTVHVPKTKTLDELAAMKDKAARFLRDVVNDPDHAEDFEAMSPEDYADHKNIQIKNPFSMARFRQKGLQRMATKRSPSKADLEDRIDELESENEALNDKLDSILDIAAEDDDSDGNEDDQD